MTKALILAAGRGERMRPLSDDCPKPLLPVRGKPMVEWHLEALARAGVRDVAINAAWLEDRLVAALGDGTRWGLRLHWSLEGRDHGGALETAGGIAKLADWLGQAPFWLVSGDIFAPGFAFDPVLAERFAAGDDDGLLWVVPNPDFKPGGDFELGAYGRLRRDVPASRRSVTYANIALLRPRLVATVRPGEKAALGPLLFASADAGRLAGCRLAGEWHNVGTPEQLAALNAG